MRIYGRNPVKASLDSKRAERLFVSERLSGSKFFAELSSYGVPIELVNENELRRLAGNPHHQGVVALVRDYKTYSLDDIIANARKVNPTIVMLDGIEDPHNLGAVLRTADAFGVDGVVLRNRGEVQLNATVAKVSTGAIDYVKVASVSNLSAAIKRLKDAGYWIVAADGSAETSYDALDYGMPVCLVIGSEGFGISRLVLKNSDFVVKIPMTGHVNSLNASLSCGIILSEIFRARRAAAQ